jgi:hypothetical protein
LSGEIERKGREAMQGRFNITIDGSEYGVLVRGKKYGFTYKLARSPFTKENVNLADELSDALSADPDLKARFWAGEVIQL